MKNNKNLILMCSILIVNFSVPALAQNGEYSITAYQSIKTNNYLSHPVSTLLSSIKEDYKAYWYINTKRYSWLEGMAFIYPFNDSMDIKMSIRVKDYQYLEPYQWPPYWSLDTFMMENIYSVEFSLIERNTYGAIQNQKAIHEIWRLRRESPEVLKALFQVYELWKDDPDTFQDMIRAFEYIKEIK